MVIPMSIALLSMILVAGSPPTPHVSTEPRRLHPRDFELSGTAVLPTVTGPTVGPDLALTLGRPELHLRVGMQVVGGPDRTLSPLGHRVGEIVNTGTGHMCAARLRRGFRIRLCGGGQLGMVHLRYGGFAEPGRRSMPWGAITSFGDLNVPLGRRAGLHPDRVGLLLQGGVMLPVLGPAIVMRDPDGVPAFLRLPGSFGATFGAGLRVSLQ